MYLQLLYEGAENQREMNILNLLVIDSKGSQYECEDIDALK